MRRWLRKWAVNIASFGSAAFVFREGAWLSCHFSERAAWEAARRASLETPGAYCIALSGVLCGSRIIGRFEDGYELAHPGQVTPAQLARLIGRQP